MAKVVVGASKEHDDEALWDIALNDFEVSNDGLEPSYGDELHPRLDDGMV